MDKYDAIIVGAGHNGLVTAAYLARAGKRVLVLERRDVPGGTLVSESLGDWQFDMVQSGSLRPSIARQLGLSLPRPTADAAFVSLLSGEECLVISSELDRNAESIARFSKADARRWPEFVRFMTRAAAFLEESYATLIPSLPKPALKGALDLAGLGLDLRRMGRKDMLSIIRALAMSAQEVVEEYFESDLVRAAVASLGIHGVTLGPLSAGTSFNLIHNWLNRGGMAHRYIGQAGQLTDSLVELLKKQGVELRLGAAVQTIPVENYRCTGVVMATGEEILADMVISAVDPRRTFLSLVGAVNLPPEFVWNVQSIKMRGSVAKLHLGLDALPPGMSPYTTYVVAPGVKYLEKAYDAAKYGEISSSPYLEVTTAENTVSVHFQYAPYALRDGTWETRRELLERLALQTLSEHFPGIDSAIKTLGSLTPTDLESIYGLTEGDLNHGQLMLDQFFFMRPISGYGNHHTPIDNLYLCGSGVHAGGGISGASGRNAAKAILRAQRR